ncbi:MAG: hypothetical protein R2857_12100 [Vampirovibrionales bacterium]
MHSLLSLTCTTKNPNNETDNAKINAAKNHNTSCTLAKYIIGIRKTGRQIWHHGTVKPSTARPEQTKAHDHYNTQLQAFIDGAKAKIDAAADSSAATLTAPETMTSAAPKTCFSPFSCFSSKSDWGGSPPNQSRPQSAPVHPSPTKPKQKPTENRRPRKQTDNGLNQRPDLTHHSKQSSRANPSV